MLAGRRGLMKLEPWPLTRQEGDLLGPCASPLGRPQTGRGVVVE